MEVFEIKHRDLHRQSSTGPSAANNAVRYILTMAGIVLLTGAILVASHFVLGYRDLSFNILALQKNAAESETLEATSHYSRNPEKFISDSCYDEYCLTEDCIAMASRIISAMNPNADPCSDFYEYACGGYSKTVVVPLGQDSYSPFKETRLILFQNIRSVMESPSTDNDSSVLNKMKQIYQTCIDNGKRNEKQKISLFSWLDDMNLSLNDEENEIEPHLGASWPWRTIVSKLEEYQIHTVFHATFESSSTNPIERVVVDCPNDLFLPEVYLEVNQENLYKLQVYKEVIDGILSALSFGKSKRQEFIEDVLLMETEIAKIIQNSGSSHNPSLSDEKILQLKEIWLPMIGEAIQDSEIVVSCKYNLEGIITVLNQAPPRISARYIMWRMLSQVSQYLGEDIRIHQLYYTGYVPFWRQFFDKNWHACADFLRDELGLASYKALIDHGFILPTHLYKIKNLFLKLKAEFSHTFRKIPNLDGLSRKLLTDKFKSMRLYFGYQDMINNSHVLDTVYKDLETSDDYFQNVMNLKKFKTRYFFNRLWYGNSDDPVSEISLVQSPLGVHYEYDYQTNKVRMDSSILTFPLSFFLGNIPKQFKFAETSLLVRAMSHAFDATGTFYDANGKKWERALWPEPHLYTERNDYYTECFLNQTSSSDFYFTEMNNTNWINTITADMNSFQIAYDSLSRFLQNNSYERILPGINLDPRQLFYVQTAQKFCEARVPTPPIHSPEQPRLSPSSRVNIAVSNTKEFTNVFSCSQKSALNLPNKCNLQS